MVGIWRDIQSEKRHQKRQQTELSVVFWLVSSYPQQHEKQTLNDDWWGFQQHAQLVSAKDTRTLGVSTTFCILSLRQPKSDEFNKGYTLLITYSANSLFSDLYWYLPTDNKSLYVQWAVIIKMMTCVFINTLRSVQTLNC